jgi:hypothetical protein
LPATFSWGSVDFTTIVGDDSFIKVNGVSNYTATGVAPYTIGQVYGTYNGGANLSKVSVITDGTFIGTIKLHQVG